MQKSEKIKRTAQDYAGTLEDLKNSKDNYWNYLIIRGRYKAALGTIILNEFLDGKNGRPVEFTEKDVIGAIHQAWWRDFEDYSYDGHRRDPDRYFVKKTLDWFARHNILVEKNNEIYRRKILETLKSEE